MPEEYSRAARISDEMWNDIIAGKIVLMNRAQAERILTATPAGAPVVLRRIPETPHLWQMGSLRRLPECVVKAMRDDAVKVLSAPDYVTETNPDGTLSADCD